MVTTNLDSVTPTLTAVGVFIAAYQVWRGTENTKKRATLDMIMFERGSAELQAALTYVSNLANMSDTVFSVYVPENPEYHIGRQHILRLLNHREFVSASLLNGTLHERMYKDFYYSTMIRNWEHLRGFVFELRKAKNRQTLFQEFEILAKRWQKRPLKVKT